MENEKVERLLTYALTTEDISITVFPQYIDEQSTPEENIYSFAYTILIQNLGTKTVQLLSRHWYVHSAGALYMEVKGEGVVGVQPFLEPGEAYQYTSGSVIKDPVGSMYGIYTFRTVGNQEESGNEQFEVEIPKFDLMCPH